MTKTNNLLITSPHRYDILCGKGKECNTSEGSQRYRVVIDSYRQRYASALTRNEKFALKLQIYELLTKASSRFIKYNETEKAWEELSFVAARDKIGHALRFANRKDPTSWSPEDVISKKSRTTTPVPSNAQVYSQQGSLQSGANTVAASNIPVATLALNFNRMAPACNTFNTFDFMVQSLAQIASLDPNQASREQETSQMHAHSLQMFPGHEIVDLEPHAVFPPEKQNPKQESPASEPSDVLERASRRLTKAFHRAGQCGGKPGPVLARGNVMSDSSQQFLRQNSRPGNLLDRPKDLMARCGGQATAESCPAGVVPSSTPDAHEDDDAWSQMMESIDAMGIINDHWWESEHLFDEADFVSVMS